MNVVSLSIFSGPQAREPQGTYSRYLPAWIAAHHNCFAGWELRLAVDDSFGTDPWADFCVLAYEADLIRLDNCGPAETRNLAMLWRLRPLFEEGIDAVIFRDADSIATPRDRRAVDEWLDSGKCAHGINDSISHTIPLMGGMTGFRAERFRELTGLATFEQLVAAARTAIDWEEPGRDQQFLSGWIWERVFDNSLIHCLKGRTARFGGLIHREVIRDGAPAGINPEVLAGGDALLPHLGASGFDFIYAREFYRRCGNPEIEARLAACEREAGVENRLR